MSSAKSTRKKIKEINLKAVKRKVIFWTIFAVIIAYSTMFFFAFASNAHADAKSDCEAKTDGSMWNDDLKSCRTPAQWCTDSDPNNVWIDANGYGANGEAYCRYTGNHGCGTDTFFNWGCNASGEQITPLLISIINWVSIGVTLAMIAGIIYGATLYTSAGGKSDQAKKAIGIIRGAIIALLLYFAMWATLNFLIPGGLFN